MKTKYCSDTQNKAEERNTRGAKVFQDPVYSSEPRQFLQCKPRIQILSCSPLNFCYHLELELRLWRPEV